MYKTSSVIKCYHEIIKSVKNYLVDINLIGIKKEFKYRDDNVKEAVTSVDRDIESICCDTINSHFEKAKILAEERSLNICDFHADTFFVIDPVDGTTEMLRGGSNWSVSVALIYNNMPVIGMLFFPVKGIELIAVQKQGVWSNSIDLIKTPNCSHIKLAVSPRQITYGNFHKELHKNEIAPIKIPALTPKLLSVMLGETIAAAYLPQDNKRAALWDYAAAYLVIREIGGKMTSLSGELLDFSGDNIFHRDGWLVTNAKCNHNELLKILSRVNLD